MENHVESSAFDIAWKNRNVSIGLSVLLIIIVLAVIGPIFTKDPFSLSPMSRLKPPGDLGLFGTDQLGRDVFSRVVNGGPHH